MRNRTKLLSLVAVCCVVGFASAARAECREEDQKAPTAFHTEYVKGKPILVIDTRVIICGHPPRPAVAYITTAKTIDYTWETLEQKLLPRILDSVKQAPLSIPGAAAPPTGEAGRVPPRFGGGFR